MMRKAYQPTRESIPERRNACQEEKGKTYPQKGKKSGKEKPEMWITFRISIKDLNKA